MVDGPGVVTGRYGTIGEVFFIEEPFWPLNTALYIKDFRGNSRRFVFYTLRLLDYRQYSDKGAVPGVNRNDLHRAPAILPPPKVQQAFETILGSRGKTPGMRRFFGSHDAGNSDSTWVWFPRLRLMACRRRS